MLALMVAAIMILGAVAQLGFIADLISKPTMIGYMNGLALTILVGQLPKLFGFKVNAECLIHEVIGFVKGLANGEAVPDVDTTASDMLEDLDEALNAAGISLVFAELKDPVRDKVERYGLTRAIDPRHFLPTLESAVAAFCQETRAEWSLDQARPAPEPARWATLPRHPASWRQTDNHPPRMTLAGGRAHTIIWTSPPALSRGRQVK